MNTFWNVLTKTGKALKKIESFFLGGCILLMLILVLAATLARVVKIPFITWSEELSRTLMVWLGLIGAASAMRSGENFSVNAVYTAFKSESVRRVFFGVIQIAMLAYGILITYFAIMVCAKQHAMGQMSPAMQTPMWISYFVLIIFGVSTTVQSLIYYMPLVTGKKKYISDATLDAAGEGGDDIDE